MKERMRKKRKDERKKEKEERKEEGKGNHRLHCWHVARPDVLLGHIRQLFELGRKGASSGKIACTAGCLLKEMVLIETTRRNQGYRFQEDRQQEQGNEKKQRKKG